MPGKKFSKREINKSNFNFSSSNKLKIALHHVNDILKVHRDILNQLLKAEVEIRSHIRSIQSALNPLRKKRKVSYIKSESNFSNSKKILKINLIDDEEEYEEEDEEDYEEYEEDFSNEINTRNNKITKSKN